MFESPKIKAGLLSVFLMILTLFSTNLSAKEQEKRFEFNAGIKGGLNAAAVEKVPTGSFDPPIAGGFGIGGAYGLALEFRAFDIVGLETGFYHSHDRSSGETIYTNTPGNPTYTQQQKVTSLRIPLLLKLTPAISPVRPVLGIGIEYVSQQSASFGYQGDGLDFETNVEPTSYTILQATLGIEIDLTEQLRIPIELRGGYQPGWDGSFNRRISNIQTNNGQPTGASYQGDYQGHFGFFTGVNYRWDF